jgi:hypothetical protein
VPGTITCGAGEGLILQEYPGFELDVRNEEQVKAGQHGIWDFFSFYGKRNITFSGIILGADHSEVVTLEERLKKVFSLPSQPIENINDGYITISWVDVLGQAWQLNAKIQQDLQFRRTLGIKNQASFFISLKASDPYILSVDEFLITSLMGWRQGQFILPSFLPNNINIFYNNLVQFYQNGTSEAPVTFKLYGSSSNPKITKLVEDFSSSSLLSNFNSGWIGGTDDTDHFQTTSPGRKLTSSGSQDFMNLAGSFDLDYSNTFTEDTILNSCDGYALDGTFIGLYDATNVRTDLVEKIEGRGAVAFDIVVSISPNNYAELRNTTISLKDITDFDDGYLEFYTYIPDVTNITSIDLTVGSNSGANGLTSSITTDYLGNPFSNGWNKLQVDFSAMTTYGTGLDYSALDTAIIRFNYGAGQGDMNDCRIDCLTAYKRIRRQWITFWMYIDDISNMAIGDYSTSQNYIKFSETIGVDEFVLDFRTINATLQDGWNFCKVLKDQFEIIGSPSWNNIVNIEFSIKSRPLTSLNITFSDLYVQNIDFTEYKLELAYVIPSGSYVEFDSKEGTILLDGITDVSSYLTSDSEWFYASPKQNTFIYESDTNPNITFEYPTQRFDVSWRDAML